MNFDELIASCFGDSPAWDTPPCRTCGSTLLGLDPTPYCIPCAKNVEDARLAMERVVCSLDALADLAPKLPRDEKERVQRDLDFVALAVAKLSLAVSP